TGSDPVKFTADDELAAEVNAPFAIFSPVPLEEGVTEEILSEVKTPELSGYEEPVPGQEIAAEKIIEEQPPVIVTEVEEPSIQPVPDSASIQELPAPELQVSPSVAEEEKLEEVVVKEVEPMSTYIPPVPEQAPEPQPVPQAVSDAEPLPVSTPVPPVEPKSVTISEAVEPPPYNVPVEQEAPATTEWEYEEDEYVDQPQEVKSKFGSGFIIGLIVGLAIGALVLCAYIMYFVNANPNDRDIATELIESHVSDLQ
ncbi:MAG: hypothetical protein K2M52_01560, partial [Paramuribaculum sp.]|nr:hypothetical protein [Paramuribaculum sp.]